MAHSLTSAIANVTFGLAEPIAAMSLQMLSSLHLVGHHRRRE
ncbi:hypothetical protein [Rhodococcoides yunnanense]|nr:hypothetical protein [Rhodococcus yunnanensis]